MRLRLSALVFFLAVAGCFPWKNPEQPEKFTSVEAALKSATPARRLNLHAQGLKAIPVELKGLSELSQLSLRGNPLTGLGADIGALKKLTWLDFGE